METGIKVGDIMTRNFVHVKPDSSIIDCAREMIKKRVGSLIIMQDNLLKGLLTERDIIWALTKKSSKDWKKIKAEEVGTSKVVTIKPASDLFEALQRMKKSKYRWLPVVENRKIIGMLTVKDILRVEPSLFEPAREIMQIREETERLRKRDASKEGNCEECGNFDILSRVDNRLICESCRDAM